MVLKPFLLISLFFGVRMSAESFSLDFEKPPDSSGEATSSSNFDFLNMFSSQAESLNGHTEETETPEHSSSSEEDSSSTFDIGNIFSSLSNSFNRNREASKPTLEGPLSTFDLFGSIFGTPSNPPNNGGAGPPTQALDISSTSPKPSFDLSNLFSLVSQSLNLNGREAPSHHHSLENSSISPPSTPPPSQSSSNPFLESFSQSLNISMENPLQSLAQSLMNIDLESPFQSLGKLLNIDLAQMYKTFGEAMDVDLGIPEQLVAESRREVLAAVTGLNYGSACSWEAEEYRQNITRELFHSNFTNILYEDLAGGMEQIKTMALDLYTKHKELGYSWCPNLRLLVCDRDSQKCVCGDSSYESIHGVNRSLYVREEDGKCRWNRNSYCHDFISGTVFERMFAMVGLPVELGCRAGTSCKTRNGEYCSVTALETIMRDRPQSSLDRSPMRHTQWFANMMTSGKICSCKDENQDHHDHHQQVKQMEEERTATATEALLPLKRRNFRERMDLWKNLTRDSDNFS